MAVSKYPYQEFSGALQQRTTIHIKKPNEVVGAKNVNFDKILGAMVRRDGAQGSALDMPALPVYKPVLGAFIARYPTGTEIWAASNTEDDTSSTLRRWIGPLANDWADVQDNLLANAETNMIDDLDETWVTQYRESDDTLGNPFTVNSDHDVSSLRLLQFAPRARFFIEFNGAIYAANAQVGSYRFRDRLYKSSGPTGAITFARSAQIDTYAPVTLINQVPAMTDYSVPLGTASASSEVNTNNRAWKAFDRTNDNRWIAATNVNEWVKYDFGTGVKKTITYYSIVGERPGEVVNRGPKTWTFEGSNDGVTYDVLDTQTNVPTWGLSTAEKRTYSISNTTPYQIYRLNVQANQGADYITIEELELLESTTTTKSLVLALDSVRYIKPGMTLDIYAAGTDTKLFTVVVATVDKAADTITFFPLTINFTPGDVSTGTDSITINDSNNFPTGTPVKFATTSALPAPLVADTTYYVISGGTAATAPRNPTVVVDGGGPENVWSNPTNAETVNGTYAFVGFPGARDRSNALKATNFGFTIPTASAIIGITAEFYRYGFQAETESVSLIKAGTEVGLKVGTDVWPDVSSEAWQAYGGQADLWGQSWTPADINANNFGFSLTANNTHGGGDAHVDGMRMTVYYSDNGTIKVATSLTNAQVGVAVNLSTTGTGQHTLRPSYAVGNKDEMWGHDRKGKLTRYWNSDYRTPETSDWLKLPATLDGANDITGVGTISSRLFIFTENTMKKYDGQNLTPLKNDVGCISHKSICYYDSFMVWLDGKGQIWVRNEEAGTTDVISVPVQKILKRFTQDQLRASSAVCVGYMYKITLGEDPETGKQLRLTYNFQSNQWSEEYFTPQMPVQIEYTYEGIVKPHFFDEHGQLWVDEQGDDDNGEAIAFDPTLGEDSFGVDEVKKYLAVKVYSDNSAGTKVLISIDRGQWIEIGQITKPVQTIQFNVNKVPKGTLFNLRFVNSLSSDPVQIEKATVYYNREEDTFRATPR